MHPFTGASPLLGLEAAGTILEVGSEAAGDFRPGERVMALCKGGAYAEQVPILLHPLSPMTAKHARRLPRSIPSCLTVSVCTSPTMHGKCVAC